MAEKEREGGWTRRKWEIKGSRSRKVCLDEGRSRPMTNKTMQSGIRIQCLHNEKGRFTDRIQNDLRDELYRIKISYSTSAERVFAINDV